MHLIDMFNTAAQRWPDRIFLREGEKTRDYATVRSAAIAIAKGLRARGVGVDTRVGIMGPNTSDLIEGVFGIFIVHCIWVPVNVRSTASELVDYLTALDVDILLYTSSVTEVVRQAQARLPHLRLVAALDGPGRHEWLAGSDHVVLDDLPPRAHAVISLTSSGGTTGKPKGVALTELNWETAVATAASQFPGDHPVFLLAAPMSHAAGGLALMFLPRGPELIVLPSFEPEAVMAAIEKHHITHLFLPPTAIYMMLSHPKRHQYDFSSLKYFIYAGAPMSVDKLREALALFGPVMTQFYAQMECFGSITCLTPDHHAEALADPHKQHRLASAGQANIYARVEIMGENGDLLKAGERGEIVVRSNLVFSHYVGVPDDQKPKPDTWHHTSDVGYRDEDGFFYIVDRLRDMIITGGFNVYPSEVEQAVLAHPAVKDCAVIGVPDEKWGEAVVAFIEVKPSEAVTESDLIAFCRKTLSGVKTPKRVIVVDELPRSPVGKVLRRVVRDELWKNRPRNI
ncbi:MULTISPECIES: AMP-binding protein [unclassified Beijerinckia]|uniref:class I adenylate-forming enzyme family protein n=1 Tax=unclassified Beijerinckia TaxID=2638183 RepID=UPI00089ACD3D|nr:MULTISPECIES: AMP-binding protein [unclassified Beijerinckia]MDH7799177.1 acyl-CoA synthetase (AMP-forming)/AMP-acid ligase II [Beijerinckia sp. GAS462]SED92856.1 Acyl-CoA synthetase (AMP-forming)/AMP-acid ligase II [Beijerinckia sp. 28-YEA-48]